MKIRGFLLSLLPFAALLGLTLATYFRVLDGGFIWDDDGYVVNNVALRSWSGLYRIWFDVGTTPQYYPMVFSTFWIEYQLWGANPLGYHLINVLLHAGGAMLLYLILRRVGVAGAWIAACVFAVHPVLVESVAWITERKNVLSGVFYLASALAYLRFAPLVTKGADEAEHPRRRSYLLSLGLFLLAMLSKTVTVTLPCALLLLCWWKTGRVSRKRLLHLAPMFCVGLPLALLTVWLERVKVGAMGPDFDFSFLERVMIAGRSFWFYLEKLVLPVDLSFIYPRWSMAEVGAAAVLYAVAADLLVATLWFCRRKIGRGPLTAVLFFGGTLFPALGFFNVYPFLFSFVADHFQYLAAIGPLVLLTAAGTKAVEHFSRDHVLPSRLLAGVLVTVLAILSWSAGAKYQSLEALWRDTLKKNPDSWMVHNNLGVLLLKERRTPEALVHLQRATNDAPIMRQASLLNDYGHALTLAGQPERAIEVLQHALERQPDHLSASTNLGVAFAKAGQLDQAIAQFRSVTEMKPDSAAAHINLGTLLRNRGYLDKAVEHFTVAIELDRSNIDAAFGLGDTLLRKGEYQTAIKRLSLALQLTPPGMSAADLQTRLRLIRRSLATAKAKLRATH